jgi:putative flippase GtrA
MRIVRFAIAGLVSTGTHVAVALVLGGLGLGPGLANGGAFCVALIVSWYLNTVWTFGKAPARTQLARYSAVSALGLVATIGIAELVRAAGGTDLAGIGAVVLLVPAFTYTLHARWTFAG